MKKHIANGLRFHSNPIKAIKLHPNAEALVKDDISQIGYDLSIVARDANRVEDIYSDSNLFTTGLALEAPPHCHIEIIEHPQLYKTGYTLLGGPRIINPGDHGEVMIPLLKFREGEDLELPFRAVQIVLRETEHAVVTSVGASPMNSDYYEDELEYVPQPQVRRPRGGGAGGGARKQHVGRKPATNHMF